MMSWHWMRRIVSSSAAAAALALALAAAAREPGRGPHERCEDDPQRSDYPAIVVGSGYGGSVAAFYLARAGVKTLVLERGREWTVNDPTRNATFATLDSVTAPGGDVRSTWMNERCVGNSYLSFGGPFECPVGTGILEQIDDSPETHGDASPPLRALGVRVLVAAGVGGGSLVNNGVAFAPTKAGWDVAFPPSELPFMQRVWSDLNGRYFARAERRLDPEPTPPDVLESEPYAGTRLMSELAGAAGYPLETRDNPATTTFGQTNAPVTVDWDVVRDEIAGRRIPAFTLGETYWGNNSGAKRSLDKPEGYLGRALATGRVVLAALHTVTDIEYDAAEDNYHVVVTHTDEAYAVIETRVFTTRRLFLAAGSMGTTKLLVRARDSGALPDLNEHVGTRWSTNGDMAHFRIVSSNPLPQAGPGGVKITDFSDPANPVVIEAPPLRVPGFFESDPRLRAFRGAMLTIGFGVPTAHGSFSYDASTDTVVLDWPTQGAANVYERVTSILSSSAFPGTPVILPQAQSQGTSFHPLGGVPLGLATDLRCGLRGYAGLYAVDGSIVPGAAAVANPALLITALAERCMDRIIDELERDRSSVEEVSNAHQ